MNTYFRSSTRQCAIALALCVSMGAIPGIAAAAQPMGWYGGVSVGTATVSELDDVCGDVKSILDPGASCKTDDTDTGWKLYAGNRFNENLAVEFGFADLGQTTVKGSGTFFGVPAIVSGEWDTSAFFGAVVGVLPVSENFSLFGKAGLAYWDVDLKGAGGSESDSGLGWMAGAGLQFDINRTVGLRVEWENYFDVGDDNKTGQSDVQLLSAGVVFRF